MHAGRPFFFGPDNSLGVLNTFLTFKYFHFTMGLSGHNCILSQEASVVVIGRIIMLLFGKYSYLPINELVIFIAYNLNKIFTIKL